MYLYKIQWNLVMATSFGTNRFFKGSGQQIYLLIGGFVCCVRPHYNEVPLYLYCTCTCKCKIHTYSYISALWNCRTKWKVQYVYTGHIQIVLYVLGFYIFYIHTCTKYAMYLVECTFHIYLNSLRKKAQIFSGVVSWSCIVSRALPLRDFKVTFACIFKFTIYMHF